MSASLAVLIPVVLLGVVVTLCFAGCGLDTQGIAAPAFTTYSGTTVLGNSSVVAYWPLGDTADNVPAIDRTANPDNGQYIDPSTKPAIYPWPAVALANPPGPDVQSAAAPGSIVLAQPGIVAGDSIQPGNDPTIITPCLVVNGSYVNVPFKSKINPPKSFTIEAWVRVDWTKNDTSALRYVMDARDFDPCTGFGLLARADDGQTGVYHWQAIIGNGGTGTAGFTYATSDDPPITLNDPSLPSGITYHLVVTYNGPSKTLILYVDGEQRGPKVNNAVYKPNTKRPLWIGAGAPYVPLRPQAPGVLAGPLFAFDGAIQDVAIYKAALSSDVVLTHYHNGNGIDP
jgi:Concanavalin A-like lectin/glucanases superfamily